MARSCLAPGCPRRHYGHGWCRAHYDKWRAGPLRRRRPGDPVPDCLVPGCDRPARVGVRCHAHHSRYLRGVPEADPIRVVPPRRPPVTRPCGWCGKPVTVPAPQADGTDASYCDQAHLGLARRHAGGHDGPCEVCGTPVHRPPALAGNDRLFCSLAHYQQTIRTPRPADWPRCAVPGCTRAARSNVPNPRRPPICTGHAKRLTRDGDVRANDPLDNATRRPRAVRSTP